MDTRVTRVLAGLAAALLLSLAVASASANNLSTTAHRFRLTWSSLRLAGTAPIPEVRCPVTLEGSFHSATIHKTVGALTGHVTRTAIATCTGGTVTIKQERLPWHARYKSFGGTLPNITSLTMEMVGARWEFTVEGVTCSATSTAAAPGTGILNVTGGRITGMTAEEVGLIPFEGGGICASFGRAIFAGTASVTVLNEASAITLRLI
jgi:hypothetical protein